MELYTLSPIKVNKIPELVDYVISKEKESKQISWSQVTRKLKLNTQFKDRQKSWNSRFEQTFKEMSRNMNFLNI